jgi:hypothetical protein
MIVAAEHGEHAMTPLPDEVHTYITHAIREGFRDEEEIVEDAIENAEQEGHKNVRRQIRKVTAELFAAHLREQAGWQKPTDCDRLDEAFAAMESRGVVARQNFSCCSNCGHGEMWDVMQEAAQQGDPNRRVLGYAFYHMQDTDRAVEGGDVYIKYGAIEGSEQAAVAVGRIIADEVREAGLAVQWNGSAAAAVAVTLDWKKRR